MSPSYLRLVRALRPPGIVVLVCVGVGCEIPWFRVSLSTMMTSYDLPPGLSEMVVGWCGRFRLVSQSLLSLRGMKLLVSRYVAVLWYCSTEARVRLD